MLRLLAVTLLVFMAAGCTVPPYHKADTDQAQMMNDYNDCYTKAALEVNTPEYPDDPEKAINDKTRDCMVKRGYEKKGL